jgi:phage portal protein BeeE
MAGIPEAEAVKTLSSRSFPGMSDYFSSVIIGQGGQFANTPEGLVGAVRSNVWAYNSVKARMAMVATPKIKLYKGTGDDRVEIDSHPILDLLRDVNPINLNARSFMRGVEQQLSHFGRCVIHKNRGTTSVSELFILPVPFVEVLPDPRRFIGGYRWLPTGEIVPPEDVIDLFYPSADGSVNAESPAAVALAAINRYNMADRAQTAIDMRGGQKGGLVIHPPEEISDDFDRTSREWDRKRNDPDKAGSDIHVPHGTDYKGDAFSAIEMQREERVGRLAKEIMAGFSMPPAAAGDYTDASILANAAVQMAAAWDLFGTEELAFIAEGLNNSLLWAEYKGSREAGLYLEFDMSTIAALSESVDAKVNRAVTGYQAQIISVNEARALAGFDRIDNPLADAVPIPGEVTQPKPVQEPAAQANPIEPAAKAQIATIPIIDPVGRMAVDEAGTEIGKITKVARFNVHNGITATADDPVVYIGDNVFKASTLKVVLDGE